MEKKKGNDLKEFNKVSMHLVPEAIVVAPLKLKRCRVGRQIRNLSLSHTTEINYARYREPQQPRRKLMRIQNLSWFSSKPDTLPMDRR